MEESTVKNELLKEEIIENTEFEIPEEKPFDLEKRDIIFSVFAAVSCVFTAIFGLFGNFALGLMLSALLLIGVLLVYLKSGNKFGIVSAVCGVFAVVGTVSFITTSNGSVRFFTAVETLLLCLVLFDSLASREKGNSTVSRILSVAYSTILNIPIAVKSLFSKKDGKQNTLYKALIGVLCAIPALLIIVPLLASSDTAFNGMMNAIISNSIPTVAKAILGLLFSTAVISYGLTIRKNRFNYVTVSVTKDVENIYIISFLSAVSLAYLLYLFSQLAYFFSAFNSILPAGYKFTVAAYARRGFFELCVIAVINFLIVLSSVLLSSKNDTPNIAIKALCTFISVFTLLISATAISKMALYINSFGMTVLRLTTSSFIIFLSIVFAALLLRIYIPKIRVIKMALITAAVVLIILGTVNVNAVAAKYNYNRYIDGTLPSIDVAAMANLGDEGVPYLTKLAKTSDYDVRYSAQLQLKKCYTRKYFNCDEDKLNSGLTKEELLSYKKYKGIESFSIPKYRAYQALYDYMNNSPKFPK